MALKQEQVLIRNGYDIGIGVAAGSGSPMALGATGVVSPPQVGSGGSGSFTFRRVQSNEELATELGIGADVSAGIGLFSSSASFDFTKKCKIQSSSLSVLVSAEEKFAFQQMDSPVLSPAARDLINAGDTTGFAEQFGDYFVRGIDSGGRFLGLVRIDTKSSQAKEEVDAALSAHYGLVIDAEAKLKISSVLNTASARAEAFIISDGGRVTTRPTSNDPITLLNQLFTAMDEWTASVANAPKAYSVTLAPYAIALGAAPPNLADLEHQRDVLIRCAKLRSHTFDMLNLVEYILDPKHTSDFTIIQPPLGPDLPAFQAALSGDLEVIADAASFAIRDAKNAKFPEAFMRENKNMPGFKLTALPPNMPQHTGPTRAILETLGGTWRINEPANFDISKLVVIPTSQSSAEVAVTFVHGGGGGAPFERSGSATFDQITNTLTTVPIRKFPDRRPHFGRPPEFHTVGMKLNTAGTGNKAIITQSVNRPAVTLTGDFTRA